MSLSSYTPKPSTPEYALSVNGSQEFRFHHKFPYSPPARPNQVVLYPTMYWFQNDEIVFLRRQCINTNSATMSYSPPRTLNICPLTQSLCDTDVPDVSQALFAISLSPLLIFIVPNAYCPHSIWCWIKIKWNVQLYFVSLLQRFTIDRKFGQNFGEL